LNHQQRQHLPGIKLIRVKMMAAAAVFINFLVKSINFEEIIFSDYALKEGVISQVVENILAEQNS
jgi:exopolyphosphatase/pppGpp-phosphohydrolase